MRMTLRKAWFLSFIFWLCGIMVGIAAGYFFDSSLPIAIFSAVGLFMSASFKVKAYKNRHLIVQKELNELSKFIFILSTIFEYIFSLSLTALFVWTIL